MLRGVAVALVLLAASASPVAAHGPCSCLRPASGPSGTRVSSDSSIYKVVFNPDRTDLGIGPESLWDEHKPGAPVVIYRETWRYTPERFNAGGSFTIPRAEPGRYLVALYDGGEGGQHYTWEWFTVTPGNTSASSGDLPEPTEVSLWLAIGSAAAALLLGLAAGLRMRRS